MKRIATKMPDADPDLMEEFIQFSKDFIVENFQSCVLPFDTDLSLETWLDGTNYTAGRKKELTAVWDEFVRLRKKDFDVKTHIKYESYTQPKHFRGIYSRSDIFKCFFGPVCAAIGKKFFSHQWFVKYLSNIERVCRIRELFDDDFIKIFSNDFTSFEATFIAKLMEIEVFFFEYCTQYLPNAEEIMDALKKAKFGVNRIVTRKYLAWLKAKRYSGEMDTSLSNSLVNLLFVCFLLHKSGHSKEFYTTIKPPQIEGDDCLGAFVQPLDDGLLLKLGAKAKIEYFDSFSSASFCGMVFSGESNAIIRDPISAILDFGYVNYRYLNASKRVKMKLLRAKGLSLLYSYPGCPVLRSLALYALRITTNISDRHAIHCWARGERNLYLRDKLLSMLKVGLVESLDVPVTMSSRILMAQKFNVSVADQLAIEVYLDSLIKLQSLNHPAILVNAGVDRICHYDNFTFDYLGTKGKPLGYEVVYHDKWFSAPIE